MNETLCMNLADTDLYEDGQKTLDPLTKIPNFSGPFDPNSLHLVDAPILRTVKQKNKVRWLFRPLWFREC